MTLPSNNGNSRKNTWPKTWPNLAWPGLARPLKSRPDGNCGVHLWSQNTAASNLAVHVAEFCCYLRNLRLVATAAGTGRKEGTVESTVLTPPTGGVE